MNKNIQLGILFVIIIGGFFYWFQVRPAQARKECIKAYPSAFREVPASDGSISGMASRESAISDKAGYEKCLREHGLEK